MHSLTVVPLGCSLILNLSRLRDSKPVAFLVPYLSIILMALLMRQAQSKEVDPICTYGNHTECATFSITSLGHLAIILGHTWLTEHNPEVNWCSGEVSMTRCPESCGVKPVREGDRIFPRAVYIFMPLSTHKV